MIKNSLLIIVILLFIETVILYLAEYKQFKKYFSFLPHVFWIYFLPMLASTVGLIDSKSLVYQTIITNFLPASLVLLLLAVDIKSIMRLGRSALIMFFAGSFGIMVGTTIVFSLFKGWVGGDFWSGFGALSASWTGGSANMIAVKEAIGTPDTIFAPMVVVDTIVPYVWMGFLVAMSGAQALYDRWNRSDRVILDELAERISHVPSSHQQRLEIKSTVLLLVFAMVVSFGVQGLAPSFPTIKNVISATAWTIILVTLFGILLSFTPIRKIEQHGASRLGYFLLYFVLTAIGAKASLTNIGSIFILFMAGFLIVILHAGVLIFTARLIKAPMFLVAVASQANVGGVASTPIVAEIYQPGLASVGLLLAILGNICGTYLGILTSQICYFFR